MKKRVQVRGKEKKGTGEGEEEGTGIEEEEECVGEEGGWRCQK